MDVMVCKLHPMRLVWSKHKGGNSHNDKILTLHCVFQSGIAHQLHYNLMSCYRKMKLPSIDSCHFKERIDICSYLTLPYIPCKILLLLQWSENLDFGKKEEDLLFSHTEDLSSSTFLVLNFANPVGTKQFCLVNTHMAMMVNLICHPTICSMPAHCLIRQICCSQIAIAQVEHCYSKDPQFTFHLLQAKKNLHSWKLLLVVYCCQTSMLLLATGISVRMLNGREGKKVQRNSQVTPELNWIMRSIQL